MCNQTNPETWRWEASLVNEARVDQLSGSPTPSNTSIPQQSNKNSTKGADSSNTLAVGLGAGVGIGVPLLAAVLATSIMYIRERRQRRSAEEAASASVAPTHDMTAQQLQYDISRHQQPICYVTQELPDTTDLRELPGQK